MMSSRTATITLCLTVAILLNCMAQGKIIERRWDEVALIKADVATDSMYCKGRNHELASANRVELLRDDEVLTKETCEAAGYCWDYDRASIEGLAPCFAPEPSHWKAAGTSCNVELEYRVSAGRFTNFVQCRDIGGCWKPDEGNAPSCFFSKIWYTPNRDDDSTATDTKYCQGRTWRSWQSDQTGYTTKKDCEAEGLCWDPKRPRRQCFSPYGDKHSCAIPDEKRVWAGYSKSSSMVTLPSWCEEFGGCWEEKPNTPACYHANIKDVIVEINNRGKQWRKDYQEQLKRAYNANST